MAQVSLDTNLLTHFGMSMKLGLLRLRVHRIRRGLKLQDHADPQISKQSKVVLQANVPFPLSCSRQHSADLCACVTDRIRPVVRFAPIPYRSPRNTTGERYPSRTVLVTCTTRIEPRFGWYRPLVSGETIEASSAASIVKGRQAAARG